MHLAFAGSTVCICHKPDILYLTYPDYRTIALLFCLMIIVAGFQSLGIFSMLGHFLITRAGSVRGLSVVMVLLCFFSSMVITNDVTLITFVPFTILVLRMSGRVERIFKIDRAGDDCRQFGEYGDAYRKSAEFVSVFYI